MFLFRKSSPLPMSSTSTIRQRLTTHSSLNLDNDDLYEQSPNDRSENDLLSFDDVDSPVLMHQSSYSSMTVNYDSESKNHLEDIDDPDQLPKKAPQRFAAIAKSIKHFLHLAKKINTHEDQPPVPSDLITSYKAK